MSAKTTALTPEATALVQQARVQLSKALATLPAEGHPLMVSHLHAVTGPALRAGTAIKRAGAITHAATTTHTRNA